MVWLITCFFLFLSTAVEAKPLDQDDVTSAEKRKSKEEKDAAIAEAEAKKEAQKDQFARVIVLRDPDNIDTDHANQALQRNVRSAIEKTDALFLPAIDLFQDGREIDEKPPRDQPTSVSEEDISKVLAKIREMEALSFDDVDPNEWLDLGDDLRKHIEHIWFVDRPEVREPLFLLYAQIGRVADNIESSSPPFFEHIGNSSVNYYYYLAAHLAFYDSTLLSKLTDEGTRESVKYYLDFLQKGIYPSMEIGFQLNDIYNAKKFGDEYEILINGLPVEIDKDGNLDVFLGRSDILLKRKDAGFSLSDRLEAVKTEEKAYRVLDIARQKVETKFWNDLMTDEKSCNPKVSSYILNYLSIYAQLHREARNQIYIAVPENGNPNKVWIWRFDPDTMTLNEVQSGKEEFPVHFVATVGVGALFSGASVAFNANDVTPDKVAAGETDFADLDLTSANIPFIFDLRIHYNRLMVQFGREYGLAPNGEWTEYYQTPGRDEDGDLIGRDETIVTVTVDEECLGYNEDNEDGPRRTGDPAACTTYKETYRTGSFSENRYLGAGYVFGRDAAFGYGFRVGARWGFVNMPKSWATTLHVGYTYPLNMLEVNKRVRPVVDADFRVGTMIARPRNLSYDIGAIDKVSPLFGLTVSAGTTF